MSQSMVIEIQRELAMWDKFYQAPFGYESLSNIGGILSEALIESADATEGYGPNLRDLIQSIVDAYDSCRMSRLLRVSERFRDGVTEAARDLIKRHKLTGGTQ